MSSDFTIQCPKHYKSGPRKICKLSINKLNDVSQNIRKKRKSACPWYINDPESKGCFWIYILKEQNRREHSIREISILMNYTVFNAYLARGAAIRKLRKYLKDKEILMF